MTTKHLLFIIFGMFLFITTAYSKPQEIDIDRNSIVARVDRGSVTLDQVMELWGPAYYEVLNKAQKGSITSSQINPELQKAWVKAVNSVVRDEMFYQEALNDYENKFQQLVTSQLQSSSASGDTVLRSNVEDRLRRLMKKKQDEQVNRVINDQIKAAGGVDNLNKVLKSRGLTYKEWKDRIVRKAFTYSYLFSVFEPLGISIEPRPQQILSYYKKNKNEFTLPGKVIFDHILVSSEKRGSKEKAEQIAQKIGLAIIDKKISFATAASKYSDDPVGSANSGRVDGISQQPEREAWLKDVREAVKDQEVGQLEILESPIGYHITVLLKKTKGQRIPYKMAQKQIISRIKSSEWEKESNKFYDKLKSEMMVDIKQKTVPKQLLWHESSKPTSSRKIGMSADPAANIR